MGLWSGDPHGHYLSHHTISGKGSGKRQYKVHVIAAGYRRFCQWSWSVHQNQGGIHSHRSSLASDSELQPSVRSLLGRTPVKVDALGHVMRKDGAAPNMFGEMQRLVI